MNVAELERLVEEAANDTEGRAASAGAPFFVNATAGSTGESLRGALHLRSSRC
jgi:hypothetical protein